MRVLIIFSFLLINISSFAQIGLTASYVNSNAPNWNYIFDFEDEFGIEEESFFNGFQYGVDYWFRLKETRIEFFPTLSFANFENQYTSSLENQLNLQVQLYQFSLTTNIYPFDFFGDCNCPTWSNKSAIELNKAFFFQLSPGITHTQNLIEVYNNRFEDQSTVFHLGLGMGLDIGFNDYFAVSPFVRVKRHFNLEWASLDQILTVKPEVEQFKTSHLNQFEAGIRIGLRWKAY